MEGGEQEINLKLAPRGKALGLDVVNMGLQFSGSFYGAEAVRIQRGKGDVLVIVRYPLYGRSFVADLTR